MKPHFLHSQSDCYPEASEIKAQPKCMAKNSLLSTYLNNQAFIKQYLYRFFSRKEDVEDTLQETYFRVNSHKDKEIYSPKSYILRIAKNIALDSLCKKSNTVTDYMEELLGDSQDAATVTLEEQVYSDLSLEMFTNVVNELPEQCRKVFQLRHVHGLNNKAIALELSLSISTVEKHLAKALHRCTQLMHEKGYAYGKKVKARASKG